MAKYLLPLLLSITLMAETPLWMRYPTISPDGATVVFSYKGDLYRVSSEGGMATALTLDEHMDTTPVWSRDGQHIAFASNRFGNYDVFLMPAHGGKAKRLTWDSGDDIPYDFAPNDQKVIFGAARMQDAKNITYPSGRFKELYEVPTQGGRVQQLLSLSSANARYNHDGSKLVFQDIKGVEDNWRKHHRSSVTRDIHVWDLKTNRFQQISTFDGEDLSPVFSPDGAFVYYLSAANGSHNLFRMATDGSGTPKQLTQFYTHPLRFLSLANNGTFCFGYHGEIFIKKGDAKAEKLAVTIQVDSREESQMVLPFHSGASEMSLSPNQKEMAIIYRGDVFVLPIGGGTARQITVTPEEERSVSFSPDGRSLLYASDRGSWHLYKTSLVRPVDEHFFDAAQFQETPVLISAEDTFMPAYSPDGKEIAFIEDRYHLRVINLATKERRTIVDEKHMFSYGDSGFYFRWSPDSRWFLLKFLQENDYKPEIGLVSASGKADIVNLSESGYEDYDPKWRRDGKMFYWFSARDGLLSRANNASSELDVYAMFFSDNAYERFRLSKEEFALLKEKEAEEEKKRKEEKATKKDKKGKKAEKKEAEPPVPPLEMNVEDIADRKVRLTLHSSRLEDAVLSNDGEKLYYLARFEKQYNLWVTNLRTHETKMHAPLNIAGGALRLDKDGKKLYVVDNQGNIKAVEIESAKVKSINYSGDMKLKPAEERSYYFDRVHRTVAKRFYDPTMHGAPWDDLVALYKTRLPYIEDDINFAELLGELIGELNASHSGARLNLTFDNPDNTGTLGAFYDPQHNKPGLKILEVVKKGPLARADVVAGEVITKINDHEITLTDNIAHLLNRTVDKTIWLEIRNNENIRLVKVKPISRRERYNLLYQRWLDRARKTTDEQSQGTIGYIHVSSMSDHAYRTVIEEVLGKMVNRKALIVDTRNNTGGDLVDDLVTFLSGKAHNLYRVPRRPPIGYDSRWLWTKPSIVLVNQANYSDAHCFPASYQGLGLGKVVGMPIAGTCTFGWGERFPKGTVTYRAPNIGVAGLDGEILENKQLEPDIRVENSFEDRLQGKDRQLMRSVDELLKQLNGNK